MAANINRVVLVGNLTKDPELRHTPSGTAVCSLRLAVNTRRKDSATGEWTEKPNYFDITVWGNQGESCAQYLAKGRPIAVDGPQQPRNPGHGPGQVRKVAGRDDGATRGKNDAAEHGARGRKISAKKEPGPKCGQRKRRGHNQVEAKNGR